MAHTAASRTRSSLSLQNRSKTAGKHADVSGCWQGWSACRPVGRAALMASLQAVCASPPLHRR